MATVSEIVGVYFDKKKTVFLKSSACKPLEDPLLKDGTGDSVHCRICHEDEDLELLSPCRCVGSVGYICRKCFDRCRDFKQERQARCELCHFAFLYECEPVTKLGIMFEFFQSSWTGIAVLIVFLSQVILKPKTPSHGIPPLSWMSVFALYEIVMEIGSWCTPRVGSIAYSLKRLYQGNKAKAGDLWLAHKREWARASISPDDEASPWCTQEVQLVISVLTFLYIVIIYLGALEKLGFSGNPRIVAAQEMIVVGGVAFVCLRTVMQGLSLAMYPPYQICRSPDEKPIVRSLSAIEKQCVYDASSPSASPKQSPSPSPYASPSETLHFDLPPSMDLDSDDV